MEMELALTEIPGKQLETPGKQAMVLLPLKEPKPPLVRKVDIVVKILDPIKFPTLTKYTNQMLRDLQRDKILNDVVGLDVIGQVREYKFNIKKNEMELIGPDIGSRNVVPKESYMYAMTLPDIHHYLMLRHIEGRLFRCLAYFTNHDSYAKFLNVFFTNKTHP